jgi:hypothetical protein
MPYLFLNKKAFAVWYRFRVDALIVPHKDRAARVNKIIFSRVIGERPNFCRSKANIRRKFTDEVIFNRFYVH